MYPTFIWLFWLPWSVILPTTFLLKLKTEYGLTTQVSISSYICHCCKRCARKRQKGCLPQEMVFDILLHLPALVIHDVMRHVCGEWNLMIRSPNFIRHHLWNSTGGIIIQRQFSEAPDVIYLEMRRGRLEISKFDRGSRHEICTSCNGLTLIRDSRPIYSLCH